ncbi:MAG: flagellar hook-associated protein FlgK [Acidimicrobiales bacterium]
MGFTGLSVAASGLNAAQRGIELAAHNLANIGTDGYTRTRIEQVSRDRTAGISIHPELRGDGVTVIGVSRIRDSLLDTSLREQMGGASFNAAHSAYLERTEGVIGQIDGGLPTDMSAFWDAWDALALSPADAATRATVIEAGDRVASTLSTMYAGVRDLITAGRSELEGLIAEVNASTQTVVRLNDEIVEQQAIGNTPSALLDARDMELDRLAELTGARIHTMADGRMTVSLGGLPIVSATRSEQLTVAGNPPTVTFENGDQATTSGAIGGIISATRSVLPGVQADLDIVALELRDSINAIHGAGLDLAGIAGQDFFSGTGAADLSVSAAMTWQTVAASLSGAEADGNNALAIAGLRLDGGSSDAKARAVIGKFGAIVASARDRALVDGQVMNHLIAERSSLSGVDLDEELTTLLRYQRSYEASARALTVVDEMLGHLINRTGVVGR